MQLLDDAAAKFMAENPVMGGNPHAIPQAMPQDVPQDQPPSDEIRQLQMGFSDDDVQNLIEVDRLTTKIVEKNPSLKEAVKYMAEMMELGRQDRLSIAEDTQRQNELDEKTTMIKERRIELEKKAKLDQIELDKKAKLDQIELDKKAKMDQIEIERRLDIVIAEKKQRQNELDEEATRIEEHRIEVERQAGLVAAENKQRLIDIGINERKALMDFERQVLENRKRKLEMDREEKEISENKRKCTSQPPPADEMMDEEEVSDTEEENSMITVASVAKEHPELFLGIPKSEHQGIRMKAGGLCWKAYKAAGKKPVKIQRGDYLITVYKPEDKETFILPALKSAIETHKTNALIAKNIIPIDTVFTKKTV